MESPRLNERTNECIRLSSPCARVPSFIPSVARVVRRSVVPSSARSAVARVVEIDDTFDSSRFKRGSVSLGVCVFSVGLCQRERERERRRERAGWMDGWCERKGFMLSFVYELGNNLV